MDYSKLIILFLILPATSNAFTLEYGSTGAVDSGWSTNSITLDYDPTCANNSAIQTALAAAASVWSSLPSSSLSVSVGTTRSLGSAITTYTGSSATQSYEGSPLVYCDSNFDADFGYSSPSDIPGLELSPTLNCGSGTSPCPISGSLIVLNVDSSDQTNILNFSASLQSAIVAHELGHALGLGHSADESALMYYNATNKTTLRLAQDDVDGMSYLYPRNEFGGSGGIMGCGSTQYPKLKGGPNSHQEKHEGSSTQVFFNFMGLLLVCLAITRIMKVAKPQDLLFADGQLMPSSRRTIGGL